MERSKGEWEAAAVFKVSRLCSCVVENRRAFGKRQQQQARIPACFRAAGLTSWPPGPGGAGPSRGDRPLITTNDPHYGAEPRAAAVRSDALTCTVSCTTLIVSCTMLVVSYTTLIVSCTTLIGSYTTLIVYYTTLIVSCTTLVVSYTILIVSYPTLMSCSTLMSCTTLVVSCTTLIVSYTT
ncbi:unnamed protein product [Merluccius merluccius]